MKILAIDDNKDNLTTLKAIAQDVLPACTLLTALNGPCGLELALAEDPDVILLDIVMPGMDGYEVCRRLKADERSRPIPVVFLTALRTDRESRIQALDSGADGFLAKPVDEQELVAEVRAMARVKTAILMQRDETTRLAALVAERTQSLQQSERSLLNTLEDMLAENEARKQAEVEAKREQVLSNTIIDSIPGAFYLLDEHGRYIRWNTYQRDVILGKPDDQMSGMNAIDTIHPEDRALIQALIANVLRDGKNEMVEARVLLNGGPAFIWMLMTGRRMTFAGRPCLVGSGIDITERKLFDAYRELNRNILQILNESSDLQTCIQCVIAAVKTRTGFEAVGLRLQEGEDFPYCAQDGLSKEFLLTENTLIEHASDGGVCRDKDGKPCLECTCGLVISGKTDPASPFCTKGGSFWTNDSFPLLDLPANQDPRRHPRNTCIHQGYASFAVVPIRTQDQIVGLIHLNDRRKGCFSLETVELLEGVAAHIGSALMRRQAEEDRTRSHELLVNLAQQVPGVVYQYRLYPDGRSAFPYSSPGMNDIYEVTPEEVREDATPVFGRLHPEDAARVSADIHESARTLATFHCEFRVILPRQGLRWRWSQAQPQRMADGGTLWYGIISDITERKQTEAEHEKLQVQFTQAQKMEAVGRLAGGVAHDFNNLLMGMTGYVQLCRDEIAPDHPIQEYLAEITHEAERSAEITRQLLAFARKQTIAPRVLALNDTVAGMLKLLQRLIGEDIKLVWRPGVDLRPVKLDPSQVDQILANLCVNARDAIAGVGEVTLETGSTAIDPEYCARHKEAIPGSYVFLAVSDDGCGMDKETLAQVFEPFFTTKGLGKGTGLGLATVYGIVKQNNGFIYAYSEPGKGTTFKIHLPEIATETVAETVTSKAEAPRGRGETILLAEDEKSLRVTCGLFLEALGYKVLTAETPGEALKMVAGHPGDIHVLLTDVVMPGMDGRQLAKRISAVKPGVKVVFMSGYTSDVIAQRGVLDEGVQFMSKPFTRDDLARKVRAVLEAD